MRKNYAMSLAPLRLRSVIDIADLKKIKGVFHFKKAVFLHLQLFIVIIKTLLGLLFIG